MHTFHKRCLEAIRADTNSCLKCREQTQQRFHLEGIDIFEQAASRYDLVVKQLEVFVAASSSYSIAIPNKVLVKEVDSIVRLLHRAARFGHVGAYFVSGILYASRGVVQHRSMLQRWSREPTVADAHAEAQYILGRMQKAGRRVRRQDIESFEYFTSMAARGVASGMFDSVSWNTEAHEEEDDALTTHL